MMVNAFSVFTIFFSGFYIYHICFKELADFTQLDLIGKPEDRPETNLVFSSCLKNETHKHLT